MRVAVVVAAETITMTILEFVAQLCPASRAAFVVVISIVFPTSVVAVLVVVAFAVQLNPSTIFKLHKLAVATTKNSAQNKLFFLFVFCLALSLFSVLCSHLKPCSLSAKFLNNAAFSELNSRLECVDFDSPVDYMKNR